MRVSRSVHPELREVPKPSRRAGPAHSASHQPPAGVTKCRPTRGFQGPANRLAGRLPLRMGGAGSIPSLPRGSLEPAGSMCRLHTVMYLYPGVSNMGIIGLRHSARAAWQRWQTTLHQGPCACACACQLYEYNTHIISYSMGFSPPVLKNTPPPPPTGQGYSE
ncbi:hypothetical protein FKM82_030259 [Ascaphus truei]